MSARSGEAGLSSLRPVSFSAPRTPRHHGDLIEIEPSRATSCRRATNTPCGHSTVHSLPLPRYGARSWPGLCSCPGGIEWLGGVTLQPCVVAETGRVDALAVRECEPPPPPHPPAT